MAQEMAQASFTIIRQFISFCALGAVGTLAQYIVLVLGIALGKGPIISSVLGFTVGAVVNYALSYYCIFRSNSSHPHTVTKFFTIALFGLMLNTLVLSYAINELNLHYLAAQILATGIVVMWNFIGNRWWTFREVEYGTTR